MYRNNDGSPLEVPESALFRPAVDHTVLRHSAKDYGDSAKQFHLGFQDGDWWRHGCSGGTTWEEVAAVTRIVDQFDSGRHHRSKATVWVHAGLSINVKLETQAKFQEHYVLLYNQVICILVACTRTCLVAHWSKMHAWLYIQILVEYMHVPDKVRKILIQCSTAAQN